MLKYVILVQLHITSKYASSMTPDSLYNMNMVGTRSTDCFIANLNYFVLPFSFNKSSRRKLSLPIRLVVRLVTRDNLSESLPNVFKPNVLKLPGATWNLPGKCGSVAGSHRISLLRDDPVHLVPNCRCSNFTASFLDLPFA
jgi:hypothetical protein